jgi:hypothetical protein
MNRLEELFQQGRLLFTPKVYPKYLNNKLRVFKPSVLLQIGLATAAVFGLSRYFDSLFSLWQLASPN